MPPRRGILVAECADDVLDENISKTACTFVTFMISLYSACSRHGSQCYHFNKSYKHDPTPDYVLGSNLNLARQAQKALRCAQLTQQVNAENFEGKARSPRITKAIVNSYMLTLLSSTASTDVNQANGTSALASIKSPSEK